MKKRSVKIVRFREGEGGVYYLVTRVQGQRKLIRGRKVNTPKKEIVQKKGTQLERKR